MVKDEASRIITREEFDKAVADFHRADSIEKSAGDLRESARAIILDYWRVNMDEFTPVGEDGKTMSTGPGGVSITVPTKKGVPAHFDEGREEECIADLNDLGLGAAADELFIRKPVFAGPSRVISLGKEHPEWAASLASALMKYTVPATPDEPQTPRVSPVKGKKKQAPE